jgi:phage recombination protein Bet
VSGQRTARPVSDGPDEETLTMTAAIEQTAQTEPVETPPAEPETPVDETRAATAAEEPPAEEKNSLAPVVTGHLSISPEQTKFTPEQKAALRAIGIVVDSKDADENFDLAHVRQFLHFCQVRRLDPFAKDVYLTRRKGRDGYSYSIQTSIDTYRRKARETRRFRRKVGVFWTGAEDDPKSWMIDTETRVRYRLWDDVWLRAEPPAAAKCVIEYYDEQGDIVQSDAVANWDMFVGTKKDWNNNGKKIPNEMWSKGGPHMLAKCAEALALRQAFPATLSGVFIHEEMSHLDSEANAEYMERLARARQEAFERAQAAKTSRGGKVDEGGHTMEGTIVGTPADHAPDTDQAGPDEERGWLLDELDEQARILGQSRVQLLNRLTVAHRCNPEDLPVAAVRQLVLGLRPLVAEAMEQRDVAAGAGLYGDLPTVGHPEAKGMLEWVAAPSGEAS